MRTQNEGRDCAIGQASKIHRYNLDTLAENRPPLDIIDKLENHL